MKRLFLIFIFLGLLAQCREEEGKVKNFLILKEGEEIGRGKIEFRGSSKVAVLYDLEGRFVFEIEKEIGVKSGKFNPFQRPSGDYGYEKASKVHQWTLPNPEEKYVETYNLKAKLEDKEYIFQIKSNGKDVYFEKEGGEVYKNTELLSYFLSLDGRFRYLYEILYAEKKPVLYKDSFVNLIKKKNTLKKLGINKEKYRIKKI